MKAAFSDQALVDSNKIVIHYGSQRDRYIFGLHPISLLKLQESYPDRRRIDSVFMAEFLRRGYNVAVPEVDVGDDIFVVRDSDDEYSRVQVKTALIMATKQGYSARYTVRLDQLVALSAPELWYVFANRVEKI